MGFLSNLFSEENKIKMQITAMEYKLNHATKLDDYSKRELKESIRNLKDQLQYLRSQKY